MSLTCKVSLQSPSHSSGVIILLLQHFQLVSNTLGKQTRLQYTDNILYEASPSKETIKASSTPFTLSNWKKVSTNVMLPMQALCVIMVFAKREHTMKFIFQLCSLDWEIRVCGLHFSYCLWGVCWKKVDIQINKAYELHGHSIGLRS